MPSLGVLGTGFAAVPSGPPYGGHPQEEHGAGVGEHARHPVAQPAQASMGLDQQGLGPSVVPLAGGQEPGHHQGLADQQRSPQFPGERRGLPAERGTVGVGALEDRQDPRRDEGLDAARHGVRSRAIQRLAEPWVGGVTPAD